MKKSEFKAYLREEIISVLSEADQEDIKAQQDLNKELDLTQQKADKLGTSLSEEDEEPSDAEIKKGDSVSKIANKLGETTREMKTLVKKYKDAEEPEKSELLSRLKELTKIKKELEGLL
jgi:gas vesicle protein